MKSKKFILRNKYFLCTLLLLIISVASFGMVKICHTSNDSEGDFVVVTSFYPMYIATMNITDNVDGVEIHNLTANSTGCLHDYQLSTKDLKLLDSADMLVVNGGGMESFLDDVFESFENLTVVNATENVELLTEKSEHDEDEAEDSHVHEEEPEHDHEDGHVHNHGEYNSHSWMDIDKYIEEVEWIAKGLIENDPMHETEYEANLEKYKSELKELSDEAKDINLHAITAGYNSKEKSVVLFHEAFEYLEEMMGFSVEDVINMDEDSNLSAAQIGEIIDKVNSSNVQYILTDEEYGKSAAIAIQKECDVKIVYINPLTSGENEKDSYIKGMKKNLEFLKEAFS